MGKVYRYRWWYRAGAMLEVLLMTPAAQMRTKVSEMIGASCKESMAAWTQCNRSATPNH